MKALILLSHGSRRSESNDEMKSLAARIRALPENTFTHVACAFQQFAAPTFQEVIKDLMGRGVHTIVVLPLFLASGSHVRIDVPEMIDAATSKYPELSIAVRPHLGQIEGLDRFLLTAAADNRT